MFVAFVSADTQHQFNARESDWGFTSFMPLSELYDPSRGYLVNDTVVVEAEVSFRRMVDYWAHDSKKETGYVGLKNQRAACYMNFLTNTIPYTVLQEGAIPFIYILGSYCTLLIIFSSFKAVYHMPTTKNDMPSGSIPLALQNLFHKLQYSDSSVATKQLKIAFYCR